eukprot:m.105980 g.105980  ORF g.105980 m.105980 type:complete len:50 (+) comp16887_c0_seq1:183-332(+)
MSPETLVQLHEIAPVVVSWTSNELFNDCSANGIEKERWPDSRILHNNRD